MKQWGMFLHFGSDELRNDRKVVQGKANTARDFGAGAL
ncbi:DUF4116 domain-containing protein [Legionella rowbothamii]